MKIRMYMFWLFFKKIWFGYKKFILIAGAAVAGLIILLASIAAFNKTEYYYYIDYNGEKGIASWCDTTAAGLVCDKQYGGKIMVKEYRKVDK